MTEKKNPVVEAARKFVARGFAPLPLPYKEKGPTLKKWPGFRTTLESLEHDFGGDPKNIGVILGEASGGLIDIDLDCPETIVLAERFLPPTTAIFGRKSKPQSHYLYQVEPSPKMQRFEDVDGSVLVEIRSTGGQTMFPPSMHPSGELAEWEDEGEPSRISSIDLQKQVRRLAAGALLMRHWPEKGSRQELALAVSNVLARAGLDEEEIRDFLKHVTYEAGDEESDMRAGPARYAPARIENEEPAYGFPKIAEFLGEDVAKRLSQFLDLEYRKGSKTSLSELAYRTAAERVELWRTPDDRAYATVPVNGHREHMRIGGSAFRKWLRRMLMESQSRLPRSADIDEAVQSLEAMALGKEVHEVAMRIGEHDGKVYIDLCDDAWRAVEIDGEGFRVIDEVPVRFIRSPGMLPLPEPKPGHIEDLRPFVNVKDDDDFVLFVGLLFAAMKPAGPYPIGIINGEQGTAKSTLARIHRDLVDPSSSPSRSLPSNEEGLYVAGVNGWVLSFDNVSFIQPWLADALCRVATGSGFSKRQLYTDMEEVLVYLSRPVLLNGIPSLISRADLMDRAITVTLPVIPPEKRRPEAELKAKFKTAYPRIFGALCAAVSAAIRNLPGLKLDVLPRMADSVLWVTAGEESFGWKRETFLKAYEANYHEALIDLAANDPVVIMVQRKLRENSISMTATDLLRSLTAMLPKDEGRLPRGWPTHPNRLSGALRRLAPAMRELGIEVRIGEKRDADNRVLIEIYDNHAQPF